MVRKNPRILKSGDKSSEDYKELWDTISAGKVWRGQFHNKRKDGEIYWEAASISPVRDSNGIITHYIAVKDSMHVNLYSRQLALGLVMEVVKGILQENGLPPSALTLEITESMLVGNPQAVRAKLKQLSAIGIGLVVDDFGASHSSLSFLKRLPMDTLKIDRSFVSGLPTEYEDTSLVKAIVAMAHSLGFRVMAQGVETSAQLSFLERIGCELAQGPLLSRPVAADKVPELARRQLGKASNTETQVS